LLIVVIIVLVSWLLISETGKEKTVVLLSVGLIASFILSVIASLPPIIEIPLNESNALRVYPSAAYPFCIQQYRDYDAHLFRYIVSFGWPEGLPLLQFALQEDQSHFIHAQHYLSGLSLGLLLSLGMAVLVGTLAIIERKVVIGRRQSRASAILLIALQLALITQVLSLYLSGNIIYPIGGIIVMLVTLYPTYRAVRGGGSLESQHKD
jgi:hypothetical protein